MNKRFLSPINYFILAILGLSLATYSCDTNDECEGSSTCINGFFQSTVGCECFCYNEWEGRECDTCLLVDADCPNGSVIEDKCQCECDPEWCGVDCDIQVLPCQNSGTWNEFSCECDCQEGWAGEVCDSMI
ncbi:MAG: hypothetical protein GY751_24425 [Bacteroidetes bacterium]|nr:hypothetical protein [Bacteroidota bacterium]